MTRPAHVPRLAVALALALGLGPLAAACARSAPATQAGSRVRKYPVRVEVARTEPLTYRIEAIGALEAEEWVQVSAEVEGVVGDIRFQEGDRVDRKTLLAEIDRGRYELAVEQRQAALSLAVADVVEKEAALKRRTDLRARGEGFVPEEEIVHHQAQLQKAQASVAEAKAALDLAKRDLQRARVHPPIEGFIERREASTGLYVRPGTVIATIVRTKPIRVRFSLREEEAAKVRPGTRVEFAVPAYPKERFEAEVFFVARAAEPRTRRVDVLARDANDDGRLKPGYFARVAIETEANQDAVVLPESALLATEEGFVAYVVEDGRARKRRVDIGLETKDGRVEIRSGIAPGDRVVVRGAGNLQPDVEVAEEPGTGSGTGSVPEPKPAPVARAPGS